MRERLIVRNSARCVAKGGCGEEIESTHRHDFVTCTCGAVSVDGGRDYLRRVGNPSDYIDTSITTYEYYPITEWEIRGLFCDYGPSLSRSWYF